MLCRIFFFRNFLYKVLSNDKKNRNVERKEFCVGREVFDLIFFVYYILRFFKSKYKL